MTGALFALLLMAIAGRALAVELSIFQIVFLRNAICLAAVSVILAFAGFRQVRTAKLGRHVVRNLVHFAAQYLWFVALLAIPLSEVFAIEFTIPIWTAVLATLFLGERLSRARVAAIGLGFAGVLVVLKPGVGVVHPAALCALAAAVALAVSYVITKNLVSTDSALAIVFWMNVVQLPLGLVPSLLGWVNPSPALWPWVAAIGGAGLATHYFIARALEHADTTVVVPLDFLRLPLGAIVAWHLYAESLDPTVFLGGAMIFAGNWINLRRA